MAEFPIQKKPSAETFHTSVVGNSPHCREVAEYEYVKQIGQGTFGIVFKARNPATGKMVAMKKIITENETEGFPITALREVKILKAVSHDNIVNFIEVCQSRAAPGKLVSFYFVFEFCEFDLAGLLSNRAVHISLGEKKMLFKQLLNGLLYCHNNKIIHRDIKSSNILVTKTGTLKIADFGLARAFSIPKSADKPNRYTTRVVTLWYRPPELLLGERNYGPPVDLWGAGCVMAELWTRKPILRGSNEQHQLKLISKLCGSITRESYPGCDSLKLFKEMQLSKDEPRNITSLKAFVTDEHALDLLDKFLTLDPKKRVDCDNALDHDFFWADPLPCDLTKMLEPHTQLFEYFLRKNNAKHNEAGPSRPLPTANDGEYYLD